MKKILLLCQQYKCPIELSPARYQLFHELKKMGYEVHVFAPERIANEKIHNDIDHSVNTSKMAIDDIRKRIKAINPEFVIAFTYEDALILYKLTGIMKRTVFIYFNLEIYVPNYGLFFRKENPFFYIRRTAEFLCNKMKELLFVRKCRLFVIQDNLRQRTCKKYFIAHPHTLLIPNSYVWHEGEQVENGCSGIVYSGGFSRFQAESLVDELDKVSDVPLTFAGWCDEYFRKRYKKLQVDYPNIKLCQQQLHPEELSDFLRQYAVGLVWYTPVKDENLYNIGLASGKFFKHLSLGQPVISIECPGLGNVIRKYHLGIVIQNVSELKEAYEEIMKHYSYYHNNVVRVYKKKFDYKKVIQPFLQELQRMECK